MHQSPLEESLLEGFLQQLGGWGGGNHWSSSVLFDLVQEAPERAWPILLEAINRAPERDLSTIGAGFLEDLLAEHGRRFIDRIEAAARADPRVGLALAHVWQRDLPDDVWARLEAIGGAAGRSARDPGPSTWSRRRIEFGVRGAAPSARVARSIQLRRRRALLKAVVAVVGQGFVPWVVPVEVTVRLETGPRPSDGAAGTLAAIIETLAADRPQERVDGAFAPVAAIGSADLVRIASIDEFRGATASYRVVITQMPPAQITVFDDTRASEEVLAEALAGAS